MAVHEAICPACGSTLNVTVSAHVGGTVQENVGLSVADPHAHLKSNLAASEKNLKASQADAVAAAKALLAATKEEK
jgi:hypothetical protein